MYSFHSFSLCTSVWAVVWLKSERLKCAIQCSLEIRLDKSELSSCQPRTLSMIFFCCAAFHFICSRFSSSNPPRFLWINQNRIWFIQKMNIFQHKFKVKRSLPLIPCFSTSSIFIKNGPTIQIGQVFLQNLIKLANNCKYCTQNCGWLHKRYKIAMCAQLFCIHTVKIWNTLTHSTVNVFRYEGISLTTGLPVIVNTLSSGICAKIFTIRTSWMRLCDRSNTESALQLVNSCNPSMELSELCDKFNVFKCGNIVELQFSMHFT